MWDQTIGFQLDRESPFSVWGQNPVWTPCLDPEGGGGRLAVAVAFVPRRRDTIQVAALGAAVLIATQFIAVHWFYLYIVWFAPFLLVALFGEYTTMRERVSAPRVETVSLPQPPAERVAEAQVTRLGRR